MSVCPYINTFAIIDSAASSEDEGSNQESDVGNVDNDDSDEVEDMEVGSSEQEEEEEDDDDEIGTSDSGGNGGSEESEAESSDHDDDDNREVVVTFKPSSHLGAPTVGSTSARIHNSYSQLAPSTLQLLQRVQKAYASSKAQVNFHSFFFFHRCPHTSKTFHVYYENYIQHISEMQYDESMKKDLQVSFNI